MGTERGAPVGIAIQEAVGQESLVIDPVRRGGRGQLGDQVGRQPVPLGAGDDGRLAPAAFAFRDARQLLVPAEQGGIDPVTGTGDAVPAPMGAELDDVGRRSGNRSGPGRL